jgi:uncharacterized protein YdaU (DUF1376 family)
MSAPFMQLYVGDYLRDTRHLTAEQHGAYLLLLMAAWNAGGRLSNDPRKLARLAASTPSRWAKISADVLEFFEVEGDHITNRRLTLELKKASEKSIKRAEAGTRGGNAKALKSNEARLANATVLPWHSSEPEPDNNARALLERADDRFDEALNAYPARGVAVTSVPNARRLWTQAAIDAGGEDVLLAAVRSFAVSPDLAKRDHGAPGFHRWLLEERWRAERKATATTGVNWRGPPDIRAAVVGERGEAFASSYLDPAGWSDDGRVIAATGYAAEKLRGLSSLNDRTISVEQRQTA